MAGLYHGHGTTSDASNSHSHMRSFGGIVIEYFLLVLRWTLDVFAINFNGYWTCILSPHFERKN